ncbi:hypothetical protein LCGC14_0220610 [marine sediment metagenome]|uniref:Uncharacterized protein n=1 Tax=marine sediment metagenome TaxID=412755 RepID=A0A0F9UHQ3_9ZZZZ
MSEVECLRCKKMTNPDRDCVAYGHTCKGCGLVTKQCPKCKNWVLSNEFYWPPYGSPYCGKYCQSCRAPMEKERSRVGTKAKD